MKTATDTAAEGLLGIVSIHRVRPDGWASKPSCSLLGQGPWLPRSWGVQPNLPPLELAYRSHLDGLDSSRIWSQLHQLAGGYEPVLVNGDQPAAVNRMIRTAIAEWFLRELGQVVVELPAPRPSLAPRSAAGFGRRPGPGIDPWTI